VPSIRSRVGFKKLSELTHDLLQIHRSMDTEHDISSRLSYHDIDRDISIVSSSRLSRPPDVSFIDIHRSVVDFGTPNYLGPKIIVPSRLNIPCWRDALRDYHDQVICDFLEFGWPIGFEHDSIPSFTTRTHRGALDYPNAVQKYLHSEVLLGRVVGPFTTSPFSDGFVASPLNTVPKRDSSERRVIVDLSWPCGSSVNDGIPSDSFLGESLHLEYPTIDVIVDAVIATGPGCMIYKRDLRKAYRQFPVDPRDYHLLGWDGCFYFDTVLTMGLRSAAMACQRSTSAVSWIFQQRGHSLFNYLDDFIGVSLPSTASGNFIELGELLHDLGLEESPEKASSPSTVTVCLGVELDTLAFTLSVSEERLNEIHNLLTKWLTKRTAFKSELQSLVGKLVFVSKCVRQSRVFIARILRLLRSVKFNHHHVNLNGEFRKDIQWWCCFLRDYNGVSMINTSAWSKPDALFTTDACLTGCGGLCIDQYFHAVFPEFVLSMDLDINSLELLTIVLALKLWGNRWRGLRLTVRCDNEVAVTVLASGRCRSSFLNCCLREIVFVSASFDFELRAVHVSNRETDVLSRCEVNSAAKETFLQRAIKDNYPRSR